MASREHQAIFERVHDLCRAEQRRLLHELALLVERTEEPTTTRSIREIEGLGKDVWADVEAQEYVNKERD